MDIAVILPAREGFRPDSFGALSLCVRDFTLHSRYRERTIILGTEAGPGFVGVHYQQVEPKRRFFENTTTAYARALSHACATRNITRIEVHNRPVLVLKIAKRLPTPLVLHLANDPQEMKGAKTVKERLKILTLCTHIYCVSDYIRQRFLEGISSHHDKVHTLYNGLDIPDMLRPKDNLIVFVGRLTENKGGLECAQGLALALPHLNGWKAAFIGGRRHSISTTLSAYEQRIADILDPLASQVENLGFCTHDVTMDYMARAAIVVVPSLWNEPFGRTALEAMACGAAVISSGRGGLIEVTGDTALSVREVTGETLCEAILQLAGDAALRDRMGKAAYVRSQHFAIEKCASAIDDVRDLQPSSAT